MTSATQGYAITLALLVGAPQLPCGPSTDAADPDAATTSNNTGDLATNASPDLAPPVSNDSPDLTSGAPIVPPVSPGSFAEGVTLRLTAIATNSKRVSFGLPLPRGAVVDPSSITVSIAGAPIAADITELLPDVDGLGAHLGARAVRIQLDPALLSGTTGGSTDVTITWLGGTTPTAPVSTPYTSEDVSFDSPSIVTTADRTIQNTGGTYALVETNRADKTAFVGREPRVLATYPDGYLGYTGILGNILPKSAVSARADLQGLRFLSTAIEDVLRSAMYDEPYALNPDPTSLPDFDATYEAWLYDRCATFLIGYTHVNDPKFLRHGLRTCSYYASRIELTGANRGIFLGKPDPDIKYSHLRGLFAYYALTGDERAAQSIQAMAEMWLAEPYFVAPYRAGKLRGLDKLWTERLLGTSLEALLYGYRMKGEVKYLTAFSEMMNTAYRHITGDQATLDTLNPGAGFPPQNCFIHTAAQHGEGDIVDPWCSSWMSELALDALLQWHALSSDARVPVIIARLGRFLRDTGATYFRGNPLNDSFLQPSICEVPTDDNKRWLQPLYGVGLDQNGARSLSGEYDDFEHCTDATALAAAARWALQKGAAQNTAPAPFVDEPQSFHAMHDEFLACADGTFKDEHRHRRNPAEWTSAELAAGASDPAAFIAAQKIGFPQYQISPFRKIGWWFNMSALQFALISDAGLAVASITVGWVQPSNCQ